MGGNRTDRAPHAPIRVVLAEDSYIIREFLTTTLSSAPEVELVAVCSNAKELQTAIDTWAPDVVLTDIRMPPSGADDGIRIAARLRETAPRRRRRGSEPVRGARLRAGAAGARDRASRLSAQGADPQPRRADRRDREGRARRIRDRPGDRRCPDRGEVAGRPFAARGAHAPGARAARRDRGGQEQRGDRRVAVL